MFVCLFGSMYSLFVYIFCLFGWLVGWFYVYLTLSAHAHRGLQYSVCLSVCHISIPEKAPISGLKLTSVYILGDDLSPLYVALF